MADFEKNIDRFDAYYQHEMSAEQRVLFEKELAENSALNQEWNNYKKFIADIKLAAEYDDFTSFIQTLNKKPTAKKSLIFKPAFYWPIVGIAATLAILFTVVNPFSDLKNESTAGNDYQKLVYTQPTATQADSDDYANESAVSENATDSITLMASAKKLEIHSGDPAGTAFLISNEGYFITAYHVVEHAELPVLQNKDLNLTFETSVIWSDSASDMAILKCHDDLTSHFNPVPFKFIRKNISLGEDVFTLGYPKKDIVYTAGVISSETGYHSDTTTFEVSLPSNPGYSGAPLFTRDGDLAGLITANNSKKQAVTYVLKYTVIQRQLKSAETVDGIVISMASNFTKRYKKHADLIQAYRPFIFEVHL
ncbi:MAG: trypsin-like peptidase domain-containing protein [Crocinitomicaceae bacterium]|nr:trypsin-like peptidase domain-containing protein [Crocinitomicaceae bacterium]MBK8926720.1 trypsin-like peptidase domain-containing protein [Crocinitomicaceae bacterium]